MCAPKCAECGRTLANLRSRLRGFGPRCWEKYLDRLDPEERELEKMIGYNWTPGGCEPYFLVITQAHKCYLVNADTGTCDCVDAQRAMPGLKSICKHLRYIRHEIGWTPGKPSSARNS